MCHLPAVSPQLLTGTSQPPTDADPMTCWRLLAVGVFRVFYEGVARTVRAPCKLSKHAFSRALFRPRFQLTAKIHQEVIRIPLQGRKKHQVSSKGLWHPSTSIWEHPPEWFAVGLFTG